MNQLREQLRAYFKEQRKKQAHIEDTYSRKNIRRRVRKEIDDNSPLFWSCVQSVDKYLKGLYFDSKQKRVNELAGGKLTLQDIVLELFIAVLPIKEMAPVQSVTAQLANRLGMQRHLDAVKTASEIIAVCECSNLYTLYHSTAAGNATGTLGLRPNYRLPQEVVDFIEQTMYLPPMVCRPKPWRNNRHGGHVEGSGSVILGAMNHHDEQQSLDAINIMQKLGWELNEHMLGVEEVPNKELDDDEKVHQFERFKEQSRHVYNQLLEAGNHFYFVWKYDKRGRMYSQGYHVNLQSTEYKKAILQFKNKELVT